MDPAKRNVFTADIEAQHQMEIGLGLLRGGAIRGGSKKITKLMAELQYEIEDQRRELFKRYK